MWNQIQWAEICSLNQIQTELAFPPFITIFSSEVGLPAYP